MIGLWFIGFVLTIFVFYISTKLLVKENFFYRDETKELKFKRYQWLMILILACIPFVNLLSWLFAVPLFAEYRFNDKARNIYNNSWIKKFLNYLDEEIL